MSSPHQLFQTVLFLNVTLQHVIDINIPKRRLVFDVHASYDVPNILTVFRFLLSNLWSVLRLALSQLQMVKWVHLYRRRPKFIDVEANS